METYHDLRTHRQKVAMNGELAVRPEGNLSTRIQIRTARGPRPMLGAVEGELARPERVDGVAVGGLWARAPLPAAG